MANLDAFYDTRQVDWNAFYNPFTSPQTQRNVLDMRAQAAARPVRTGYDPNIGEYNVYPQTPYTPGDPNRLPPGSPGIDIPGRQPTKTALTILPFERQENLMDPGNDGYVDMTDPTMAIAVANAQTGLLPGTAWERAQQPGPFERQRAVASELSTTPVLPRAGQAPAARNWLTSNTRTPVTTGRTYRGTNGYSYQAQSNGTFKNLGYSDTEKARRAEQGRLTGDAIRKKAGPTYGADGRDLSFSPRSVQNSVRWQTGY